MTSKIKVDNIADQDDNNIINESGDVITVGAAGDTVAVAGNIVKSNAYQASDGGNIASQSGTTITLGASGDTITLASGASQTGFGRTGTVDWNTTPKTASFTAVSGEGYFVNTTSGAITVTLPAGSAGDIVSLADYAATWQTNNVTITSNGSEKIGGQNENATLNTEGQSVTLVYVDGTQGWINTMDSTSNVRGVSFVAATGGTIITSGNFKTHVFTGPGTFCVSSAGEVDYFVVAGGGGTFNDRSAGGGGGGFRVSNSVGCVPAPTMSPLSNPTGLPVSVQGYPITVGAGGAATSGSAPGTNPGAVSTFSTISSAGGGGVNQNGGSGGGGWCGPGNQGSGNTPPVSPPQGNNGGCGPAYNVGAGGGGGAGAVGANGPPSQGGAGGAGSFLADAFIGPTAPSYGTPGPVCSTRYFAGGGGGAKYPGGPAGAGGTGGGGAGGPGSSQGTAGATNTGGGAGGTGSNGGRGPDGASGGSGIVMIRYKFQ
jgi:hypothetical protein